MDFLTLAKRRPSGIQSTTLTIELLAKTLYLTDRAVTISGVHYQPYVKEWGNLTYALDGEAGGMQASDLDFTLEDKKIQGQGTGETLSDLFHDYDFVGAKVTMSQRLQDTDGTWYSRTVFVGRIEAYKFSVGIVEFTAKTGFYDVWLPPTKFRKEDTGMGRVPEETIGTVIPIVLGDWWDYTTLSGIDVEVAENLGITRNVVPILLYDPSDDTTLSHVYRACSHRGHTVSDAAADGVFLYEKDINTLCSLELGLDSIVNDDNYVDVKLARPIYAEAFIRPGTKDTTPAGVWQNLVDRDESTYLDVTHTNSALLIMDPVTDLGTIATMKVAAIVKVTVGSDVNLLIGAYDHWPSSTESSIKTGTLDTNPRYISHVLSAECWKWNMTDHDGNALHIFVKFDSGGSTGTVRIYEMCVTVKYQPKSLKGVKEAMLKTGKRRSDPRHMWGR